MSNQETVITEDIWSKNICSAEDALSVLKEKISKHTGHKSVDFSEVTTSETEDKYIYRIDVTLDIGYKVVDVYYLHVSKHQLVNIASPLHVSKQTNKLTDTFSRRKE